MNSKYFWDSYQYTEISDLQAAVSVDLIKNLQIKSNENVLDVGCGIGNITMEIAAIANDGYVVGIDGSPSMIDQACKNLSSKDLRNLSFQVMSVTEMQFNSHFDVVFSNSVLHWIKNQKKALESIFRCLKPGGRIGLQLPLLNGSHPMISVVQDAIQYLNFEQTYANWEFPWFVPESVDAYSDLLKQIQFKNVFVREVETFYKFETVQSVLGFFEAVGLGLFLQPLSVEDTVLLKNKICEVIERYSTENGVNLKFHRMYAQADL